MSPLNYPMMFPGQASQTVGMASDLVSSGGAAATFLGGVNEALGFDLLAIMQSGPVDVLTETRNAQPAILAHSVAATLALRETGVEPSLVAGHSLGEYSAAVACGALDPFDALRVVRRRGELMFAAGMTTPGSMAAVMGLDADAVRAICLEVEGEVVLANLNSPNQMVISGEVAAVQLAGEALKAAGARRVIPLNVSGAFHSPLLASAASEFRDYLGGIEIRDPIVPLVTNVHARPAMTSEDLRSAFEQQLTSPVLWHDSLEVLCLGASGGLVLEVGPGKVLTNLGRRAFPELEFRPVGALTEIAVFADGKKAREEAG